MSADKKTTVRLYGQLGREYGHIWRLSIRTVGEAISAIEANRPGFKQRILDLKCAFRVLRDHHRLRKEELGLKAGKCISIIPVPQGAGGGIFQVILGVVLIVAGIIFPVLSPLIWLGASLLLGGVVAMLSGSPRSLSEKQPKNAPSYIFQGPQNVQQQGGPVPLLFGRMVVGSVCISASIAAKNFRPDVPPLGTGNSNVGGIQHAVILYRAL